MLRPSVAHGPRWRDINRRPKSLSGYHADAGPCRARSAALCPRGASGAGAVFDRTSTAIARIGCTYSPGFRCYQDVHRDRERVDSAWRRSPLFRCYKRRVEYIGSAPLGGRLNVIQRGRAWAELSQKGDVMAKARPRPLKRPPWRPRPPLGRHCWAPAPQTALRVALLSGKAVAASASVVMQKQSPPRASRRPRRHCRFM